MRRVLLIVGGGFLLLGVILLTGATVGFDYLGADRSGGVNVPADEDAYFGIVNPWGDPVVLNKENDEKYDRLIASDWDEYEEENNDDYGLISGLVSVLVDLLVGLVDLLLGGLLSDDSILVYENVTIQKWDNQFGEPINGEVTVYLEIESQDDDLDGGADSTEAEFELPAGESGRVALDVPCPVDEDGVLFPQPGEQLETKYHFTFEFDRITEDASTELPAFEMTNFDSRVTVECEEGGAHYDDGEDW